jgi:alpha-tubulin suppressor-like RCC1 family protein
MTGQLASTNFFRTLPTQVAISGEFIQIATGMYHTIALTKYGVVYSWGANDYGQLGEGSITVSQTTPIKVGATTEFGGQFVKNKVAMVAAGYYHSVALGAHGELYTWGSTAYGETADIVATIPKRLPRRLSLLTTQLHISVGQNSSYSASIDGNVLVWGANSKGQLGLGYTSQAERKPIPIPLYMNAALVYAGGTYEYATVISNNASTYSWGQGAYYNLGDGTMNSTMSPIQVFPEFTVSHILVSAPGQNHLAILLGSPYYCFYFPANDPNVCSSHGTCVGQDNCTCNAGYGGVRCNVPTCFGINGTDPLVCSGNGTCAYLDICVCNPGYHGPRCSSLHSDFVFTSGSNANYELGDALLTSSLVVRLAPQQSLLFMRKTFQFSTTGAGFSILYNLIQKTSFGWGANNLGQLALNTITNYEMYPLQTRAYAIVKAVSCSQHTVSINETGYVFTWGGNSFGQLGRVASTYIQTPTQVNVSGELVKEVACGTAHSMALSVYGNVYTWGAGSANQNYVLGVDSTSVATYYVPAKLGGILSLKRVVSISASAVTSNVLCDDGTILGWGMNTYGELGDRTTRARTLPYYSARSLTLNRAPIYAIKSSDQSTYVLLADGTLYGWGMGLYGQMADNTGTSTPNTDAKSITLPYPVSEFYTGYFNSFALNSIISDNTTYAFGYGIKGILGVGTATNKLVATPVLNSLVMRHPAHVSSSSTHSVFLYESVSCFKLVFDDPFVCSTRGNCTAQDTCVCEANAYGIDCSISVCAGINSTDSSVCSGHGSCVAYNTCICKRGYIGNNCELQAVGYLFATGDDTYSQLGDKGLTYVQKFQQMPLFTAVKISLVASGHGATIVRANDTGLFYGLGSNRWGVLSPNNATFNINVTFNLPTLTLPNADVKDLCIGLQHGMYLDSVGGVWTWGTNDFGQLGTGNVLPYYNPTRVQGLIANESISCVACGGFHSVTVSNRGFVYIWGQNTQGQVGDNSQTNRYSPVLVKGLLEDVFIVTAVAGLYHTVAIVSIFMRVLML